MLVPANITLSRGLGVLLHHLSLIALFIHISSLWLLWLLSCHFLCQQKECVSTFWYQNRTHVKPTQPTPWRLFLANKAVHSWRLTYDQLCYSVVAGLLIRCQTNTSWICNQSQFCLFQPVLSVTFLTDSVIPVHLFGVLTKVLQRHSGWAALIDSRCVKPLPSGVAQPLCGHFHRQLISTVNTDQTAN